MSFCVSRGTFAFRGNADKTRDQNLKEEKETEVMKGGNVEGRYKGMEISRIHNFG